MTEKEEGHAHVYRRSTYINRGNPGQNRLYHNYGVRDLRELLDRKRSERGYETNVPPPDPSFNYLKDPLRENFDNNDNNGQHHPPHRQNVKKYYNKNNYNSNFKRDKDQHGGNTSYEKNKDIENPLNIKVEFSTATGEHIYKMDESRVLPTIKHVPDRLPPTNRPFRGRGRGRGRGQHRNYQTRMIRNNVSNKKLDDKDASVNQQLHTEQPPPDEEENWDDNPDQVKEINEDTENYDHEETVDYENEEHLQDESQVEDIEKNVQNIKLDETEPSLEQVQKTECNEAETKNK